MRKTVLSVLLLSLLLSAGASNPNCSYCYFTDTTRTNNRLLILCLLPTEDSQLTAAFEKRIMEALVQKGYSAFSAAMLPLNCCLYNNDTFYTAKEIRERGFSSVLIITLIDKVKNQYHGTKKKDSNTGPDSIATWEKYYNNVKENPYAKKYYSTESRYVWEYNFYLVPDGMLLFSGRSKSFSYVNRASGYEHLSNRITETILEKKLLTKEEW